MQITKDAIAGTLESSDAMVRVSPSETLDVTINSSVLAQFGDQISSVVQQTIDNFGVTAGSVIVDDKGALDCTLRARVAGAIARGTEDNLDWGQM